MDPTPEQQTALDLFATGLPLVIQAGAGCLAGSTIVHVNRAGKGSAMPLAHVVAQLHGAAMITRELYGQQITQRSRPWDLTIPTKVAYAADRVIRLGLVTDAWCSGDREVFDVSTVGGRSVRATAQHPFLTAHGWRYLRDLEPGMSVAVNSGRSHGGRSSKPYYRYRDTRCHPHQTCRSAVRQRFGVPEHRLVVEADLNDLSLDAYLAILRETAAPQGLVFLDPDWHVHHRDKNPDNNARSNLLVMTETEHLRHHAEAGSGEHVLWQVGTDTIASVELAGVETTYDLAMAEEPHNFVANGFVVHNTGKTTTLQLLARSTQRLGYYMSFNRAIANEAARKMPMWVQSSTMHSLAMRTTGSRLRHRLDTPRIPGWKLAKIMGIGPVVVQVGARNKALQPGYLAGHVMKAITRFCQSGDPAPTRHHFPYIHAIDIPDSSGRRTYRHNDELAKYLEPHLATAWADLTDPNGRLRFSHDCQPPGTLVRRVTCGMPSTWEDVPIEDIREGDTVVSFTMNQRRGYIRRQGRRITAIGSRFFDGDLIRIRTERGRTSAVTPAHWCVARFDAGLTEGNHVTYLAQRGDQFRIGRTTWRTSSQGNALGIVRRADGQRADAVWVLSVHQTAEDAALAEAVVSHEFGVPSWTWEGPRTVMPRELFWQQVGPNIAAASRCLKAHGRDVRYPLWTPTDGIRNFRRPLKVRACNLLAGMLMCEPDEMQPSARGALPTHEGSKAWSAVTIEAERYAGPVYNLDVDTDHTYVADGIVTGNCYLKMWQLEGGDVPGDYVMLDEAQDANGVMLAVMAQAAAKGQQVVYVGDSQQQIYEWRGAVDALSRVKANQAVLTQSFRFGQQIAEVANLILAQLDSELRLTGSDDINSSVGPIGRYDATLCRTNATAVNQVLALQRRGLQPFLAGGADEIVNFARAAIALQHGERTYHPELACFETWREVQEYTESDPHGDELRMMVHLLDEYGPQIVLDALAGLVGEDQADVVVSTAHKAKGREWGSVHIASDFNDGEGENGLDPAEWRLMYVACTRARHQLDITWCKPVRDLIDTPTEVSA